MLEEDNYMTKFSKKLFVKRNEMIEPKCRGLTYIFNEIIGVDDITNKVKYKPFIFNTKDYSLLWANNNNTVMTTGHSIKSMHLLAIHIDFFSETFFIGLFPMSIASNVLLFFRILYLDISNLSLLNLYLNRAKYLSKS